MNRTLKDSAQKGFSMIGMLLSVIIIAIMCIYVMKTFFDKPPMDKSTQAEMKNQGINPSSRVSMIEKARDKARDFNQAAKERENQYKQPQ